MSAVSTSASVVPEQAPSELVDELELAHCIALDQRRRRFRWQAAVSGPGSSGVNQNGRGPGLQDPHIKA